MPCNFWNIHKNDNKRLTTGSSIDYTVPLFSVPDVAVYPGLLLHLQPLDEPSLVHLSCYEHILEQLALQYHMHVHGGLTSSTHDKPPGHMEHKTAAVLVLGERDTWLADEPL